VDPVTGLASREWFQYLSSLGGGGMTSDEDAPAYAPAQAVRELADVFITGAIPSGYLLGYSAATQRWAPTAPSSGMVSVPVVKTADFTLAATEVYVINNKSGSTCTVTLPSAAANSGVPVLFQNWQPQFLVSASANVTPLAGGSAGTAILDNVAGNWAMLVSNGTTWVSVSGAPYNILLTET
jgi:hypothetical protein